MTEKLIVEQFGPIKKIEIDLSKILILIGPQSTGKSTIAKLVAILRSFSFVLGREKFEDSLEKYKINAYLKKNSFIKYKSDGYSFVYQNGKGKMNLDENHSLHKFTTEFLAFEDKNPSSSLSLPEHEKKLQRDIAKINEQIKAVKNNLVEIDFIKEIENSLKELQLENDLILQRKDYGKKLLAEVLRYTNYSVYIPAERMLVPVISNAIMNFLKHDIPVPKILTEFAAAFEKARQNIKEQEVGFLDVTYKFVENENRLYLNKKDYIKLSDASSGLQALLPMLLVIRYIHENNPGGNTFVIEEPELNLYPKAQYELAKVISAMCTGFNPENECYNELIITTHSPYVLTAFNNFLLAHKFKWQGSIVDKIAEIIPENSWVNPAHFNAYYLDKNGATKIFEEKAGLIADNQLDDASEAIMTDFDKLMDLYSENLMDEKSN